MDIVLSFSADPSWGTHAVALERRTVPHPDLDPVLARSLDTADGLVGANRFRTAVAPVYLRRTQADVLDELPEKVELDEWVTLPETGTVTTWAWQSVPQPDQPLDRPFAWAMITLDGADVPLLHAVDAGDMSRIRTGSRVKVRWSAERNGGIRDIACFDLIGEAS